MVVLIDVFDVVRATTHEHPVWRFFLGGFRQVVAECIWYVSANGHTYRESTAMRNNAMMHVNGNVVYYRDVSYGDYLVDQLDEALKLPQIDDIGQDGYREAVLFLLSAGKVIEKVVRTHMENYIYGIEHIHFRNIDMQEDYLVTLEF